MLKRDDIRVRDPFIVFERSQYYMYATSSETSLSYYTSTDLENWEFGGVAFEIPADFWAYKNVWAAEVHKFHGRFYLFVSLLGKNGLRGTQIAVADTPKGPFVPLVDHAVTPKEQSCIDGTLYIFHSLILSQNKHEQTTFRKKEFIQLHCRGKFVCRGPFFLMLTVSFSVDKCYNVINLGLLPLFSDNRIPGDRYDTYDSQINPSIFPGIPAAVDCRRL